MSLCTLVLGSAAAAACSAPDPGVSYPTSSASAFPGTTTTVPSEDSGAPAATGPVVVTPADSGATPPVVDSGAVAAKDAGGEDAGAGEGGGTLAGFLGETTPWASNLPATTAFQSHSAAGQAQQTPTLDCLTCHVTGGPGSPFLAAGFVATAAGGTTGAADVEVRAYATGGTPAGYSAHTDANGYFWINPPLGGTTGPYNAGARNGTSTQMMPTSQTGSDCQSSSCHGGSQGNIHLP